MDAFCDLSSWYRWQEILMLAHIVVIIRPNSQLDLPDEMKNFFVEHKTEETQDLLSQSRGCIFVAQLSQISVSSTEIRRGLCDGVLKEVLPAAVKTFIESNKLYI